MADADRIVQALLQRSEMPKLSQQDEDDFQAWYKKMAYHYGINPNPDDPNHHYNYRAAFFNGEHPDPEGHWPSAYKLPGHPRLVLDGVNTQTGEPVSPDYAPPPRGFPEGLLGGGTR